MRSADRFAIDRGGTFTDIVRVNGDHVEIRKIPADRPIGPLSGHVTYGTTVATNALLERKGVRTLLAVSEGFGDLPWIGDMTRPSLFDPEDEWPPPLCERAVEIRGRIDATGAEIEPVTADVDAAGFDAVAVVLLHSHANPAHELAVAETISSKHPGIHVALGHRCSPELGYLARIETTLVDAAITPILQAALAGDGLPTTALAMRSDGSLAPATDLSAADAVLSGPAGGMLAVAEVARICGFGRAVGLDMGGTSTDVCRVDGNRLPRVEGEVRVAGVRLRRPMLEVETIAAGGGSILTSDGVSLFVGPESAGADPGPQCAGRGGPPTLTDAALSLGLVDPTAFDPPLRPELVSLPGPAQAFVDLAREKMAGAIDRIATARGVDLADHALVAFGGAAGQHAAAVAERLGIGTVLVHPAASVLSAWGQLWARREVHRVRALWVGLERWETVEAAWRTLAAELPDMAEERRTVELRYHGTDSAIEVDACSAAEARTHFEAEHQRRYGFVRDAPIEVVNARVRRQEPRPPPPPPCAPWPVSAPVAGPARIDCPTTSVVVPPGWIARSDKGVLRLDRAGVRAEPDERLRTPRGVSLWAARFAHVAERAGAVLTRLARSVNIRQRLDCSCAVFDERGGLVANAPHIPVHLGAMGATVQSLLMEVSDIADGRSWLTNDPDAGGSHLPDLTVITAVGHQGRCFFVASRAHHVDVGGITPGSMPHAASHLAEEGLVFRHVPLVEGGRIRDLLALVRGSREPETVAADIEAQLAANATASRALVALGPGDVLATWMGHVADAAADSALRVIRRLQGGSAEDTIGGVRLRVSVRGEADRLIVDFAGTEGPHSGNLNAPRAVVRAAVLYALRVLSTEPLPLNDGALRHVEIRTPAPSILDPPVGAAVSGGNVETSQRVVDLVLKAVGRMAASQGTMNNLTFGGEGWSMYETIGGGQGASPRGPGPSGRQVHMTNTRGTDPEALEARYPLRLRRLAFRRDSGGPGTHRGGDGLVREIEALVPCTATLLAARERRVHPRVGAAGKDVILVGGTLVPWDGSPVSLSPGDRVRIETPGGDGWEPGTPAAEGLLKEP